LGEIKPSLIIIPSLDWIFFSHSVWLLMLQLLEKREAVIVRVREVTDRDFILYQIDKLFGERETSWKIGHFPVIGDFFASRTPPVFDLFVE